MTQKSNKELIIEKLKELINKQDIFISYFRKYSGDSERITRFMAEIGITRTELQALEKSSPYLAQTKGEESAETREVFKLITDPDRTKVYISPSRESIFAFTDNEWKLYRFHSPQVEITDEGIEKWADDEIGYSYEREKRYILTEGRIEGAKAMRDGKIKLASQKVK